MKISKLNEKAVEVLLENNRQCAESARNNFSVRKKLRLYRSIGQSLVDMGEVLKNLEEN